MSDRGAATVRKELVPVPGRDGGSEVEQGFRTDKCPTHSTTSHSLFQQVAECAFDNADGDGINGLQILDGTNASHVHLKIVHNRRYGNGVLL